MTKIIMVVDDRPDTVNLIGTMLKKNKYDVVTATSGKECMMLLEKLEKKPDLILLDIMMPGMSGIDVLEEMRKRPELAKIKVAFITALAMPEEEQKKIKKAGIKEYIEKPISYEKLLAIVKRLTK